ncbi:MAG: Tol-Pal system beta propeller repeat protein TolB [Coxiella sp. (in: Bacteria)]|nr:MAG: Tol-Pal system beta propeller repeat protein TolB [Coxiella sp. (in: g-proteobacteria)]
MRRIVYSIVLLMLLYVNSAFAILSLELTRGMSAAIPIALVPFTNGAMANVPGNTALSGVIHNDLQNSGQFKVIEPGLFDRAPANTKQVDFKHWQSRGVNNLILGTVRPLADGRYQVSFKLINVYTPKTPVVITQTFTTTQAGLRVLAHHISDLIFQKLTGSRGVFSTKIAYVLVQNENTAAPTYSLEVADADGFNPRQLLTSPQPIMSPNWTPNGQELAYVSFEHHEASIYLQNLATGRRRLVSRFPGINGAPDFSPNGQKLAMVLSTTGNPKIYVFDMNTHKLEQITHGYSIDTEPAWAPDGKSLLFTSNRGGSPQIYRYFFAGNRVARLTFSGNYNARGSFLPDELGIVMMHRASDRFGIAKQDLSSGSVQALTDSGSDESPSVAPNGKMVLYAQNYKGRGVLALVSIDGRIKLRLPAREGNVQEPAWSPFLHS